MMHKERLIKLAEFLESVPSRDTFDLASWFDRECAVGDVCFIDQRTGALKANVTREDMLTCGTTACAMGWAVTIPEFRKAGLRNRWGGPVYRGAMGYEAAAAFFGISYDQSVRLFDPYSYMPAERRDPLTVAARLRALAAK